MLLISMTFRGYMAPEYLYRGEISWQCDIYSLGVLIIEITTREKNCCDDKDKSGREYISSVSNSKGCIPDLIKDFCYASNI
jgi:serine/threonine protein kinase